ncbi:MAG: damage-control phosphatase ARMT1 family protein [Candidatus Hydrogenedentota bacterium]
MKITLDCIPCFLRQALEAARMATDDPALHEQVLRDVLGMTAVLDLRNCPPVVGQQIHRRVRELTQVADPYAALKARFNHMAADMMAEQRHKIATAKSAFDMAVRLAIAGNVIDMGVNGNLEETAVRRAIDDTLAEPFYGELADFRRAIDEAERILYLADNAGEIFFDRLLIERLPVARVTLAMRGAPVLNDATRADAEAAGLANFVRIIDNGSDAPGTILDTCTAAFRREFEKADLIVAKGQGNFETLSDVNANIYFLFKAKCPVIANHVGLPVGTHVAIRPHNRCVPMGDSKHAGI